MNIGPYMLTKGKPAIMGIVNVTPDSFSDGGKCFDRDAAALYALKLAEDGADILDIGGESTRPGAGQVPVGEELGRVLPVIEGIRKKSAVPISIDTSKSEVAKCSIEAGANMINDISAGRFDDKMFNVAASLGVPVCLMHMQGTPKEMQAAPHYDDIVGEIKLFLADRARRAIQSGIAETKIIIDPGIGFGKTADNNVTIIKRLGEFTSLGYPVLIGTSRKSFIGKLLGLEVQERLEATLATIPISINSGASILRVHDVLSARRFLDMYLLLCR